MKQTKLTKEEEKEFNELFPISSFSEDLFVGDALKEKRQEIKDFIATMKSNAVKEERQFTLNILDGIDKADEQMGNKGGGTKAIRLALSLRMI